MIQTFGIPGCVLPSASTRQPHDPYFPFEIKNTEWPLAGQSKAQMFASIRAGLDKKELPTPESGAIVT